MSSSEIEVVAKQLDMEPSQVFCFLLQDFDTELDFCNKIRFDQAWHVFVMITALFTEQHIIQP